MASSDLRGIAFRDMTHCENVSAKQVEIYKHLEMNNRKAPQKGHVEFSCCYVKNVDLRMQQAY